MSNQQAGPDLSAAMLTDQQKTKLEDFKSVTGMQNNTQCIQILEAYKWDLQVRYSFLSECFFFSFAFVCFYLSCEKYIFFEFRLKNFKFRLLYMQY